MPAYWAISAASSVARWPTWSSLGSSFSGFAEALVADRPIDNASKRPTPNLVHMLITRKDVAGVPMIQANKIVCGVVSNRSAGREMREEYEALKARRADPRRTSAAHPASESPRDRLISSTAMREPRAQRSSGCLGIDHCRAERALLVR